MQRDPTINRIVVFEDGAMSKSVPNFRRLDPDRPDVAILIEAMLRAREVTAARSWSATQEPITEAWWTDVLADPRARRRHASQSLQSQSGNRMLVERAYYTLADEPHATILVACAKCPWQAEFSRAELIAIYGAECPLPNLLELLMAPGCSKIKNQWDRCGVYYVNPIDGGR